MKAKKEQRDFVAFTQIKYALIAWIGGSLTLLDALPKYGIALYPVGYIVAVYWIFISGFALLKNRTVSEVYLTTRKFLVWSFYFVPIVGIVAGGYYCISILGKFFSEVSLLSILMLFCIGIGMVAHPLYRLLLVLVDSWFFPEHVGRQEKMAQFSAELLACSNWGQASRMVLNRIVSLFGIFKTALYLYNEETKQFELQTFCGCSAPLEKSLPESFKGEYHFLSALKEHPYLFWNGGQNYFPQFQTALCVAIPFEAHLAGILLVGEKESGIPYTSEDIQFFQTLAQTIAQVLEKFNLRKAWQLEFRRNKTYSKLIHKHLSQASAKEIINISPERFNQGKRRHVTILVSDLRGFTKASAQYPPEEITQFLNAMYPLMVEIISQYEGTIDKFMGDAILAVFGLPFFLKDGEERAVQCAIEMQKALKNFNDQRRAKKQFTLEMGIGISGGEVMAGYIGSSGYPEYTVIGDCVNFACHLQGIAGPGQIVVSSSVQQKAGSILGFRALEPVSIKGTTYPTQIYTLDA
jgi:class 3 adenylate cyclase